MSTLSRIALFLFLVVGLLASAQGPGTINDPFASARATPLPTRATGAPVTLTPTQRAQYRDERLDYYQSINTADFNGRDVMGVGGANDQYMNCRARCANQARPSVECNSTCDREYAQSAATNTNEVYKADPNGGRSSATGQVPQEGFRMPASMTQPRESSEITPSNGGGLHKVGTGARPD